MARCHVLLGAPTYRAGQWFNSLLVFNRRGREVFRYSKIQLTEGDARFFTPGNPLALFRLDGISATSVICHERRYPELVRLPVFLRAAWRRMLVLCRAQLRNAQRAPAAARD